MFPDGAGNGFPHGGTLGGGEVHMVHMVVDWVRARMQGWRSNLGVRGIGMQVRSRELITSIFHGVDVISMKLEAAKCCQFLAWDRYIHQRDY